MMPRSYAPSMPGLNIIKDIHMNMYAIKKVNNTHSFFVLIPHLANISPLSAE